MVPIFLGSILGLAIIFTKLWMFWSIRTDLPAFRKGIFSALRAGNIENALEKCSQNKHPLSFIYKLGIKNRSLSREELIHTLERAGNSQVYNLERQLGLLVSIIALEPMMGFLGTISGLIKAFMNWEKMAATITVAVLAGGIYEAMLTTAVGLMVAIPYHLVYNYITSKIKYISYDLADYSDDLVKLIGELKSLGVKGFKN